jgi:hypothetical protein
MSIHQVTSQLISWLNQESKPSELPLCDFERFRHELKPCDVILVEGRSRVSSVIRLITASPWTHAALYIGRIHDIDDPTLREALERYCSFKPNEQLIIESVLGKGTIVNKLSFYTNDHIRICRPSGLSYKDAQQVIRYAISRLGAEYDVRQIFDLARFLFPWILLPRRWRSSLFRRSAGDSTRTVCSTMIAEAFGFIQFPILPLVKKVGQGGVQLFRRNPKICVPSDFDYSPHFEIIKYPFIDLGLHKDYRLLPWRGSGKLSQDEAKLYFEHRDEREPPTSTESQATENADELKHHTNTHFTHQADQEAAPVQPEDAPTIVHKDKEKLSPFKRVVNTLGWREIGANITPINEGRAAKTNGPQNANETAGKTPSTSTANSAELSPEATRLPAEAPKKTPSIDPSADDPAVDNSTKNAEISNHAETNNNNVKADSATSESQANASPHHQPALASDSGTTALESTASNAQEPADTLISQENASPAKNADLQNDITSDGKFSENADRIPESDSECNSECHSTNKAGKQTGEADIKTDYEASTVEKWLRSITTGRPKSED